jgi:DNA-binding response OmpR family regulator
VLIADGNGARGNRIVEACSERGIPCRMVPHGAAALETALAEIPDVVVVQRELPLIDGEKLGAILHTNPRTQAVRLLFLADRSVEAEQPEPGVQVLAASAPPEDVAESVRALLEERKQVDTPGRGAGEDTGGGVEGELEPSHWTAGMGATATRAGASSSRLATSSTPWSASWRARRPSSD